MPAIKKRQGQGIEDSKIDGDQSQEQGQAGSSLAGELRPHFHDLHGPRHLLSRGAEIGEQTGVARHRAAEQTGELPAASADRFQRRPHWTAAAAHRHLQLGADPTGAQLISGDEPQRSDDPIALNLKLQPLARAAADRFNGRSYRWISAP